MSIAFSKRPDPSKRPQHELWTLTKDTHTVRATVRQSPLGPELLVFHDGEVLWSRVMRDSRHIGVIAEETMKDWQARGYAAVICPRCQGTGIVCEDHHDRLMNHLLEAGAECGGPGCRVPNQAARIRAGLHGTGSTQVSNTPRTDRRIDWATRTRTEYSEC